jgi:uncharacterized protein YkwD
MKSLASTMLLLLTLALTAPAQTCPRGVPCPTTYTQPVYVQPYTPLVATPAPAYGSTAEQAAFLAELNAVRARHGRGPLAWDPTLAAYAASNAGIHQPGTNGGAGQCWSGLRSPVAALRQWLASPAHLAILLSARSSVGCSVCPSGCTANAR